MKKFIAFAVILAFGLMAGLSAPALAQRKHAPKGIWQGMLSNVSDLQGIVAALSVFDMKRVEMIGDSFAKRHEGYVKNFPRMSDKFKKAYGRMASLGNDVAAAAKAGDEKAVTAKLGAILNGCNGCHYNLRDAKRRKGQ
jgi:cytochrome c556